VPVGPDHRRGARPLPARDDDRGRDDQAFAETIQRLFTTRWMRIYTNPDLLGVEVAGATKNVIAIAAGVLDGLQAGANAKSALLARGLAEISRLGAAMGASPGTFFGIAGVGDLATTCFSPHGRNRSCGEALGKGRASRTTSTRPRTSLKASRRHARWSSSPRSTRRSPTPSTRCSSRGSTASALMMPIARVNSRERRSNTGKVGARTGALRGGSTPSPLSTCTPTSNQFAGPFGCGRSAAFGGFNWNTPFNGFQSGGFPFGGQFSNGWNGFGPFNNGFNWNSNWGFNNTPSNWNPSNWNHTGWNNTAWNTPWSGFGPFFNSGFNSGFNPGFSNGFNWNSSPFFGTGVSNPFAFFAAIAPFFSAFANGFNQSGNTGGNENGTQTFPFGFQGFPFGFVNPNGNGNSQTQAA
jgi:hypothetical protein